MFRNGNPSEWSYRSLKKVLSSFANHPAPKQLYLILDAVDESEETDRRAIIKLLCQLCSEGNACHIKVFLASRPVPELRPSGNILSRVTGYITTHAQGVFVWVDLVRKALLTHVERGRNVEAIFDFLKRIPYEELNDLYNQMLERLESYDDQDIQDGVKILRFVLFARRPLTVLELYNAFAIPEDSDPLFLPYHEFFEQDTTIMEKRIMHCGGNFLETKGHKGTSWCMILTSSLLRYLRQTKLFKQCTKRFESSFCTLNRMR